MKLKKINEHRPGKQEPIPAEDSGGLVSQGHQLDGIRWLAGSIPKLGTSGNDHFVVCLASSLWPDLTVLPSINHKLTHSG